MKRKLIAILAASVFTCTLMSGCGGAQSAPETGSTEQTETVSEAASESSKEAGADASAASTEEAVGMANPWVEITEEEANANCMRLFKAPDGATDLVWSKCDELGDPDNGVGPLIQLSFNLDNTNLTARAQQGAAEDTDIAGLYVEWTVGPEDTKLANWGEGNMPAKTYRSINDTGYVDLITWYDVEIGISYALSAAAKDLDGFDIQAVAEQMYVAESEVADAGGGDFLETQSGKSSFDTYDDVIAALTPGQGYAYIKLTGSDEDVLAVSDLVFEADNTAYQASIYGKQDGKIVNIGNALGNGASYPLRVADGVLYAGDNHTYETYFLSEEYGSLMMKDSIDDGINSGSNEFTGFTRQKNTFEESTDFTGGKEEFDKLLEERDKKPVIEFTIVK